MGLTLRKAKIRVDHKVIEVKTRWLPNPVKKCRWVGKKVGLQRM